MLWLTGTLIALYAMAFVALVADHYWWPSLLCALTLTSLVSHFSMLWVAR